MKLIISVFLLVLIGVIPLEAQQFGFKSGVVVDNSKIDLPDVDVELKTGFNGGLVGNFALPLTSWGINTGLSYSYRSFSLKNDYGNSSGISYHFKMHGVEIPVNVYKEFNSIIIKPFIQAGLYASYTLSAKVKDGEASRSIEFEKNADRFYIGTNISIGSKLTSKLRFLATYGFGFAENKYIFSDLPISYKSRNLTLSIEYYL